MGRAAAASLTWAVPAALELAAAVVGARHPAAGAVAAVTVKHLAAKVRVREVIVIAMAPGVTEVTGMMPTGGDRPRRRW